MRLLHSTLAFATVFGAAALSSSAAYAWFIPDQFAGPYFRNSGGNHYTGSPRSMYACDGCHLGSENFPPSERIALQVTSQRVNGGSLESYDLFTNGYNPGERYKIRVEMLNEHLGHYMNDGSYQTPEGTDYKVDCPKHEGGATYLQQLHNRNHITAEVMNEDGVYATHGGNEAGALRPDSTGGATAEGPCLNTNRCTANDALPPGMEAGGPTSIMARHWVNDPTSNPPIGNWSCGVCDAIVSNMHDLPTPSEGGAFTTFATEFFWTAPNTAPAAEGGRIRFYIAGVDGDGYADTLDDDFASVKVAVCPAGSNECDPMVGPDWGLGVVAGPPAPKGPVAARAADSRIAVPSDAAPWLPVAISSLFVLGTVALLRRSRLGIVQAAEG